MVNPGDCSTEKEVVAQLAAFQDVVADIDALYHGNMISLPKTHIESHTGHDWIASVIVNKLTEYGKDVLAQQPTQPNDPEAV